MGSMRIICGVLLHCVGTFLLATAGKNLFIFVCISTVNRRMVNTE